VLMSLSLFAANLLLFAIIARIWNSANRVILFLMTGSFCGLLLLFEALIRDHTMIELVASILLDSFLCELFLEAMTASLASVAASVLLKLKAASMRESELSKLYSPELMVQVRVERMLESGMILTDGDRFALTAKGQKIVRAFRMLQRLFRHAQADRSGDDVAAPEPGHN
jgi:hypothetical protein